MAGHNASPVREAVGCFALFGIVLQFISIIGTEWAVPLNAGTGEGSSTFEGVGLWKYCFRQEDSPDEFHYVCKGLVGGSDIPGWVLGVQAVSLLAIIFYASALLAIITFTCCVSRRHDKRLLIVFIVLETVAGIFNLTGVVLFSEEVGPTFQPVLGLQKLAWCFIINCVADALAAVAVILAAVEFVRSKSTIPMARFINEMNDQTSAPPPGSNAPTSPPSDNAMNQSYQNTDVLPAENNNQIVPTAQITNDRSDSSA